MHHEQWKDGIEEHANDSGMIELHGGETTRQNTGGENTGAGNNVAEKHNPNIMRV